MRQDSDYRILLFMSSSLGILLFFLLLYQMGIPQIIQDVSLGLIHRTLLLNALLLAGSVYFVLMRYGGVRAQDMGLDSVKLPQAVKIGAIIWVVVQVIEALSSYVSKGSIGFDSSWGTGALANIGLLIGMLFGTALYEETGFRGHLLTEFINRCNKTTKSKNYVIGLALLVSQLLFMLMHVPWMVMNQGWTTSIIPDLIFSVFLNGVIYGLLYLRTRNLFFVMIIHALGNAPTSLIEPTIAPSGLIILLGIICAVAWRFIEPS